MPLACRTSLLLSPGGGWEQPWTRGPSAGLGPLPWAQTSRFGAQPGSPAGQGWTMEAEGPGSSAVPADFGGWEEWKEAAVRVPTQPPPSCHTARWASGIGPQDGGYRGRQTRGCLQARSPGQPAQRPTDQPSPLCQAFVFLRVDWNHPQVTGLSRGHTEAFAQAPQGHGWGGLSGIQQGEVGGSGVLRDKEMFAKMGAEGEAWGGSRGQEQSSG